MTNPGSGRPQTANRLPPQSTDPPPSPTAGASRLTLTSPYSHSTQRLHPRTSINVFPLPRPARGPSLRGSRGLRRTCLRCSTPVPGPLQVMYLRPARSRRSLMPPGPRAAPRGRSPAATWWLRSPRRPGGPATRRGVSSAWRSCPRPSARSPRAFTAARAEDPGT